jgi:hypothetical protein
LKDGVVRRYTTAVLRALQRLLRRKVVLEAVQWLAVDAVQPMQSYPQYLIDAATDESQPRCGFSGNQSQPLLRRSIVGVL